MEDRPRASAPPRADDVISEERYRRYHEFAREHGVNRFVYTLIRAVFVLFASSFGSASTARGASTPG